MRARAGDAGMGSQASDLVRLAERAAKSKGVSLWDTMLAAQGEPPFSGGDRQLSELADLITEMRKKARALTATELFDELAEALQIDSAVAAEDRKYFDRLAQFVRDWQPKSETQRLKEFVEYLDYFEQAGGSINLEQESGDAVQLMTVHAAKGWNSTTSTCSVWSAAVSRPGKSRACSNSPAN